jgi:hypothetical protein
VDWVNLKNPVTSSGSKSDLPTCSLVTQRTYVIIIQFLIIYAPNLLLQGRLQTQHIAGNYITGKHSLKTISTRQYNNCYYDYYYLYILTAEKSVTSKTINETYTQTETYLGNT